MARSTLKLICCECGDPITGMVPNWKQGAPVCRSCVFRLTFLRTVKVKEKEPMGWEKEPWRGWWFCAFLLVFVGVYLIFL